MTQGAPRKSRTTPAATSAKAGNDDDLDLDEWLSRRGLTRDRRMKVGGKWYRFIRSGSSEKLAEYAKAQAEGSVLDLLSILLVDPSEKDELAKSFEVQRQPFTEALENEMFAAMLKHVVSGDTGESSAS